MGVSAIFVSTLAQTRLPVPHDPPRDQQEVLAATLQPIVAFVVLGSIVVRAYCFSAFSLIRGSQEQTGCLSRRTWLWYGPPTLCSLHRSWQTSSLVPLETWRSVLTST